MQISDARAGERGQNELLMFMLLLGITLSLTFGTLVFGVGSLTKFTDQRGGQTAQEGLSSIASQQSQLAAGSIYRSADISLDDASLKTGLYGSTEINITVEGPSGTVNQLVETEPVIIEHAQGATVYEHGGVFSYQSDGSGVLKNPNFDIRQNRSVIPLYDIEQTAGLAQVSGGEVSIVSFRSGMNTSSLDATVNGPNAEADVTLNITSPRYRAWGNYLRTHAHDISVEVRPEQEKVIAEFTSKEVLIQAVEVALRVER
jgi:hypothetical protein